MSLTRSQRRAGTDPAGTAGACLAFVGALLVGACLWGCSPEPAQPAPVVEDVPLVVREGVDETPCAIDWSAPSPRDSIGRSASGRVYVQNAGPAVVDAESGIHFGGVLQSPARPLIVVSQQGGQTIVEVPPDSGLVLDGEGRYRLVFHGSVPR